jgi:hypothetical protein
MIVILLPQTDRGDNEMREPPEKKIKLVAALVGMLEVAIFSKTQHFIPRARNLQ